ncbi:MAG: hypothetical protein Q4G20_07055 [Paracoccus sp. (in: a-proteobacteria)]|nr:DUF6636 domain-containing protein [Paracoccus sp. (in: a-proteobacteria)]MDO5647677.1 hypothetical protein [Paracoccus sp. (in: a-proteobacteria)]
MRCDILRYTPTTPPRPADCPLDWGGAFWLGVRGPAKMICAGDTVADPGTRMVSYGRIVVHHNLSCAVRETGVTCTNDKGQGFRLSRARQQLLLGN